MNKENMPVGIVRILKYPELFNFEVLRDLMDSLYEAETNLENFEAKLKAYEKEVESAKKAIINFLQEGVT